MPHDEDVGLPLQDFLVFRLAGPMASWGSIAVGEQRSTWSRPSRSAMLGILAAALGIERREEVRQRQLDNALAIALRVDDPGRTLRDYHTAQAPSQSRKKRWLTRADELADRDELNTILSDRYYLIGARATVIVWRRAGEHGPELADIGRRLDEPVFGLFLGRKSCPLGAPPDPLIVSAQTPRAAAQHYDSQRVRVASTHTRQKHEPAYWLDETDARQFRLDVAERATRRDNLRNRARWQFSDRIEVRIAPEVASGAPS